ncbi:MAG: type IV pilus assembly protein PilM [Gammaproteobacteria bacterium]|nr:type IV pilus assembly protein PilM [Gammaproteobacteria bacterium]
MLGIDIGSYSVKAAVVKKTGRSSATIEQIAYEVLPEEFRGGNADTTTLQKIISSIYKKIGKGQSKVVFSVPTSSVILKTIEVDKDLNDSLLEGEVQLELVNFVPFPLDQVYSDFFSMGPSSKNPEKQEVFVAASRRNIIDKIANSISVKSVKTKEVDVEAFAIGQVLEVIKGKNYRDTYAVIDIGYQSTKISVFKAGNMLFNREQQIGGHHLTESIAEALDMSISEAEYTKKDNLNSVPSAVISNYLDSLSEQIGLGLEFFSSTNQENMETIYLTGGGSSIPGILQCLQENIPGFTYKDLPIGQDIKIGRKTNGMNPEQVKSYSAVASGLAMRK